MAQKKRQGTLVIIGGGEKKDEERAILREVARQADGGSLVVVTVATEEPEGTWKEYREIFRKLGVKKVKHLDVRLREEATLPEKVGLLDDAKVVFFTGGDQLKITSQLGDSPVYQRVEQIFAEEGGTIAGTSAGASVMSETMLISGDGDKSHKVGDVLGMAPGLGLIQDVVVDQHFAERGRLGRLLAAVAQNPRQLGLGLDENTAVVVEGRRLRVIGKGAVHVLDGSESTYSNLGEGEQDREKTMAVFDVKLHLLSEGNEFDLDERRPEIPPKPEEEAMKKTA